MAQREKNKNEQTKHEKREKNKFQISPLRF